MVGSSIVKKSICICNLSPSPFQPETLVSPTLVLKRQTGNCFDYSILLCSLLIGVGYDAYCMCGYATQDVALLNQIRKTCPELEEKEEVREDSSPTPPTPPLPLPPHTCTPTHTSLHTHPSPSPLTHAPPLHTHPYTHIPPPPPSHMHPYTHPYTHTQPKEEEVEQKQEKYVVRPPRDLTSQFEKRMKDKEQAQIEAEERKRREEEDARIAVSWSGGEWWKMCGESNSFSLKQWETAEVQRPPFLLH